MRFRDIRSMLACVTEFFLITEKDVVSHWEEDGRLFIIFNHDDGESLRGYITLKSKQELEVACSVEYDQRIEWVGEGIGHHPNIYGVAGVAAKWSSEDITATLKEYTRLVEKERNPVRCPMFLRRLQDHQPHNSLWRKDSDIAYL